MKRLQLALLLLPVAALAIPASALPNATQGILHAVGAEGKDMGLCPLKHTDVKVSISGNIAFVMVQQEFENPFTDKIEATYIFPLGADGAVTEMTMTVGDRLILGKIKPREEARRIYETAKAKGHVAALLDQERPNIFTQSVANIEPGKKVVITIGYTEPLKYEDGKYTFSFPMVVGPRYIPGQPVPSPGRPVPDPKPEPRPMPAGGAGRRVIQPPPQPEGGNINPPVTPPGTRAGHDISIRVNVNAGTDIRTLKSIQHEATTSYPRKGDRSYAVVELAKKKELPNKDFVIEFSTAAEDIEDALLTHRDKRGGFFTLILQPPEKVAPKQIVPRELIFVLDVSGSMRGFPLDTSRSVIRRVIANLRPNDRFNVMTFAGQTKVLWPAPRGNSEANRREATEFVDTLQGGGGTEMMKAIDGALGGTPDPERLRIVCFLTDGYVGNDMAIIDAVKKNVKTARVFSFGIGRSVNRYLLDNMAKFGRGEVEYVFGAEQCDVAADRFYQRIDAPVLTDIEIDWGELAGAIETDEVYPKHIPDLFSVSPVTVKGRYKPGAADLTGEITLRGRTSEGAFERKVKLTLPAEAEGSPALPPLWARAKVDDLMSSDLLGAQRGSPDAKTKQQIVELGMEYSLVTQYTSFVAVEEKTVTIGGEPRKVSVPVEMPEGVSYEGVFGQPGPMRGMMKGGGGGGVVKMAASPARATPSQRVRSARSNLDGLLSEASGGELSRRITQEQAIRKDAKLTEAQKKAKVAELKLVKALQGLEGKLDANGNYSEGDIVVKSGKIEVAVYLHKLDDKALEALKELGFVKLLESKAVNMVLGSIEVKKLEDLAWLEAVRRIEPPTLAK